MAAARGHSQQVPLVSDGPSQMPSRRLSLASRLSPASGLISREDSGSFDGHSNASMDYRLAVTEVSGSRGSSTRRDSSSVAYGEMMSVRVGDVQDIYRDRVFATRRCSGASAAPEEEQPLPASSSAPQRVWAAFVEREAFNGAVAALILLNMAALAVESDFPDWPLWDLVNGLFVLVYFAEFSLRLLHKGPRGLLWYGKTRRWMAYDLFLVGMGVADLVISILHHAPHGVQKAVLSSAAPGLEEQVLPVLDEHHQQRLHQSVDLGAIRVPVHDLGSRRLSGLPASCGQLGFARLFMLSRLLRIARVLRIIGPLYDCVNLLLEMMGTFMWILGIIFLLCFVLAIILTRMLGHGLAIDTEDDEVKAQVQALFADIPCSLFTLFQLTTAEDWISIAGPVVAVGDMWRVFFVVFITIMSWTMLSLLTAVASETMMAFSSYKKEEEKIFQEIQRQRFTSFLCSEFLRADRDGNHVLDKEEFTTLMSRPLMREEMKFHGVDLSAKDLVRVWDTFDIDDSGELSVDELVTGFAYLQEDLAMKHVANVNYAVKRFSVRMETDMAYVDTEVNRLQEDEAALLEQVKVRAARSQERWSKFLGREVRIEPKPPVRQNSPSAWSVRPPGSGLLVGAGALWSPARGTRTSNG